MSDQTDNVRLHPVLSALACGEDAEDSTPDPDVATDALASAPIRQVLAGFIARPIAGVAPAPCQPFEYELVETDAGIGVRTRLPDDPVDPGWGFLICGRRPDARYLEVRQGFVDDKAWEVSDTLAPSGQVLARAAQENAKRAAVISDAVDGFRSFLG